MNSNVDDYDYKEEDEEDWEKIIIPDLIKEQERRRLEERRKIEEADLNLTEDLFLDKGSISVSLDLNDNSNSNPVVKKSKRENSIYFEKKRNILEREKEKLKMLRIAKEEKKRRMEMYGEAEIDEYDEQYGSVQDKY